MQYGKQLERIADALERIANSLERPKENSKAGQHLLDLQMFIEDTRGTITMKRQAIIERLKAATRDTRYEMIEYLLTLYPNGYMGEDYFLRFIKKDSPPVLVPAAESSVLFCGVSVSAEELGDGWKLSFSPKDKEGSSVKFLLETSQNAQTE